MKKIYVVDDDQGIRESIQLVLSKAGYEVGSQSDDKDVAENAHKFGADLVILDVMFPENEGSGFDLAREIKSNERTKSIPILMLSAINEKHLYVGSFSNKDRDQAWLPVDDFVEKPISPTALINKVSSLLTA
jgi:two-component system, OmpR family, alkaline phosphatase synthesis response regulator PhoP